MKLQAPTAKHQRNSKHQNGAASSAYPETGDFEWIVSEDGAKHPFDLEERTAQFGEAVIRFLKLVPRGPHNDRLIDQLTGCSTSVGANYCEANEGVSKKDFRHIISRCCKEAKESKFFLRMIAAAEPDLTSKARELYREAKELHLIFCSIYRNSA